MRINKFLAECGVASRRNSDKLIQEGRISLNGSITTTLGTEINPEKDVVCLDSKRVEYSGGNHIYLMMNKPKGYVTTMKDDKGRKTVIDLLDKKYIDRRVFPVGRLDYETEGLLLFTTDGDFANRLCHPRNEIPKTYVARVKGAVDAAFLAQLRSGVVVDGEKTKKCSARLLDFQKGESRIEIVISEGRNRQIRKMFVALGREVIFLKRTQVGDLRIGSMFRGKYRELNSTEIDYLKKL